MTIYRTINKIYQFKRILMKLTTHLYIIILIIAVFTNSTSASDNFLEPPELYLTHFHAPYLDKRKDKPILLETEELSSEYKKQGGKIIFIDTAVLTELINVEADQKYNSSVGFINKRPQSSRVAIAGGFLTMCMSQTVSSIIYKYFERTFFNIYQRPPTPLTIDFAMTSIFSSRSFEKFETTIYKTEHPNLNQEWRIWLKRDSWIDGRELQNHQLILSKNEIQRYSLLTTEIFIESLESTQGENINNYTAIVNYNGKKQGTIGEGDLIIYFNYWSKTKMLIDATFDSSI